jgi:hypothetical protein
VFAASNQRVDRLGECLLRGGVITLAQLRTAERQFTPPERFGKVLVQLGFLTPRELWKGVKDQVEEVVRSLFAYAAGRVRFFEGDLQPDNVVRLSLPTHPLVEEGLQRRDELRRFLAVLEDPRVRLVCLDVASRNLSAEEQALLDALSREGSFSRVCRELGVDALAGARTVQLLRLVGAVKLQRGGEAGDSAAAAALEAQLRESIEGHLKLFSELAAPLVALGSVEGIRGRLAGVLAEMRPRWPELLEGLEPRPDLMFDMDPLVERARRLSQDPLGQIRAALGELIAYLEFELRNHPGIDKPEFFLDELAPLRAKMAG